MEDKVYNYLAGLAEKYPQGTPEYEIAVERGMKIVVYTSGEKMSFEDAVRRVEQELPIKQ